MPRPLSATIRSVSIFKTKRRTHCVFHRNSQPRGTVGGGLLCLFDCLICSCREHRSRNIEGSIKASHAIMASYGPQQQQDVFHKMRYYFEDWGCLICKSKKRPHVSNGMCGQCAARIQKRLFWCLQRRGISSPERDTPDIPNGEDRVRSATTLLSDLARGEWTPKRMKLRRIKWSD